MAADQGSKDERQERAALARARRNAPEQDPSVAVFGRDVDAYDEQSAATAPEDATAQDWLVADAARPDLLDETADGLDPIQEEVRRAAEDPGADEPFEQRVRRKAEELRLSEGGDHGSERDLWRLASQLVGEEIARGRTDLPYPADPDEPVEEAMVQANLGEFPELTDQGEDTAYRPGDGTEANAVRSQPPER